LFTIKNKNDEEILNQPLGNDFNLPELLSKVARHYLDRALVEAKYNKTRAAKLLGLPNYQTFDNWLKKYQ
jgi:DNA-binding protein Fis